MEGIKLIPGIILMIAIAGVIAGAASIVMSKFGDTMDPCFNSTFKINADKTSCNLTGISTGTLTYGNANLSPEYYTKVVSQEGIGTIAEQIPTVAIIAVMVIIISVIAGVFAYMRLFG